MDQEERARLWVLARLMGWPQWNWVMEGGDGVLDVWAPTFARAVSLAALKALGPAGR